MPMLSEEFSYVDVGLTALAFMAMGALMFVVREVKIPFARTIGMVLFLVAMLLVFLPIPNGLQPLAGILRYSGLILMLLPPATTFRVPPLGTLIVILGLDYYLLRYVPQVEHFFLADLIPNSAFTHWNEITGYQSGSLWILATGYLLAQVGKDVTAQRLWWLAGALVAMMLPVVLSYQLQEVGITRDVMFANYQNEDLAGYPCYSLNGELIGRSCGWMGVLIVIFTFVKFLTRKKGIATQT